MGNRVNRVAKLEEKIGVNDYGLWVVVPMGAFYNEKGAEPYWTDEPVKSFSDFYGDKDYRRVEHPDGKQAVSGVFS